MKKIISALCIAVGVISLTSCNEKAKLAGNIVGTWNSNPERIATADTRATTTIEPTLIFLKDSTSKTGGDINGYVKFSVLSGTKPQAAAVQPISVTADGKASITGRWEAIDDDEILVKWDYSSLKVSVDSDAIYSNYDYLTQQDSETIENIPMSLDQIINAQLSAALQTEVFNYGKIDDIKFINESTSMKCEINDKDCIFSKLL